MSSTMQIEFTQAMSDFKTMFPDMDHDVIEAVLRSNQGAVDATIDQLLAMSTDNQNERLRQEMEQKDPKAKSEVKNTSSVVSPVQSVTTGASPKVKIGPTNTTITGTTDPPLKTIRNWAPPLLGPLPPTFLRLPASLESRLSTDTDLEDERIALFLQNEEFMAELRWNEDFLTALDRDSEPAGDQHASGKDGGKGGKKQGDNEDDLFRERIKHMGKLSRKKFAQLAKVFTWQGNKKGGGARHGPVTDSLLLQEEHSDEDEPQKKHK